MTEQEKLTLIIDLISRQQKTLEDSLAKMEAVQQQMPFDHLQQHDLLRLHLAHLPTPKDHGDHHEFTASLKKHISTITDVIVKAIGMGIVTIISLGIAAWLLQNSQLGSKMVPPAVQERANAS